MNDLKKFFRNKKVLITGHTGFKGGWLTQILLNWGANVVGVALKPPTIPNLFSALGIKKRVKNYFADIRDFKKIKTIFTKEKPEIVFHLAAQPIVRDSYDDPLYTFETNVIGTANILQATKETNKIRAAVMITTDKVYKNKESRHLYREDDNLGGHDPYSGSKAAAEIVIDSYIKSFFNPKDYNKKHKTLMASARAGNIIGGGDWGKDRLIPDIIRAVFHHDEKIIIRNPNAIRPWQYVLEPLYGYILLAKKLYEGKKKFSGAWNFGPGKKNEITVRELVKKAFKILKRGSYAIQNDFAKHEAQFLRLDISKAKNILKCPPALNIDEALNLTLDWYRCFYNKENITKISDQQIKIFFNKKI